MFWEVRTIGILSKAVDGMVAAVNPEKGLRRMAARQKMDILNSGYGNYGANQYKKSMAGWLYSGGSAHEDLKALLSPP